jgi:YesN/AraC family two-component response regulator
MSFKVLVVDDSEFSRKNITSHLEGSDYEVVAQAANGQEALEIIESTEVDIAIIDLVMPEISGIELTQKINDLKKHITVIVISSLNHESVVMESITAGASDFIQKPIEKETLLNSLNKIAQILQEL